MVMRTKWRRKVACSIAVTICACLVSTVPSAKATSLDDYVAMPDDSYGYTLVGTIPASGYTVYVLDMVSQNWRNIGEVDRTEWWHWVGIIVPDVILSDTALLAIGGGDNKDRQSPPTEIDQSLIGIATNTNTVVAQVGMIPNQPITFGNETQGRHEDALLAYTWDRFLRTGDPNWPAHLPMTKSAVRAMDTVQSFCSGLASPVTVNHFVVTGGSKRGWTTWLTAAVDNRVTAFIPVVIDMLNIQRSFRHHHAALGFWAPAVHDYEDMEIFNWFGTPQMAALMEIVDPYEYRQRYTAPKYLVNASGDQFFLPDSSMFYFDDLIGESHLRYVANAGHSLDGTNSIEGIVTFYASILAGATRPQYSWTVQNGNCIRVQCSTRPTEVRLWQATNETARDFRLTTIDATWTSSILPETAPATGEYVADLTKPALGWTAFFIELIFPSQTTYPYIFSTPVVVVPDYLPYIGDLDFNGTMDNEDLCIFANQWLQTGPTTSDITPRKGDNIVNLPDFALLSATWPTSD